MFVERATCRDPFMPERAALFAPIVCEQSSVFVKIQIAIRRLLVQRAQTVTLDALLATSSHQPA